MTIRNVDDQPRGATLATRNVRDFVDCGIGVIDPWTAPALP